MKISDLLLALRKRFLYASRGQYFVVRREGIYFLIDIFNYVDRIIGYQGVYEREISTEFFAALKRHSASVFLDVGANTGQYCLLAARDIPDAKIVAFEPDKRNRSQMYANLFLNEVEDRVSVREKALSDRKGNASFSRHGRDNRGRSKLDCNGSTQVMVSRLDDEWQSRSKVIGIKIDVEGHELGVLRGAERVLSDNRCIVQVESFSSGEVDALLKAFGYKQLVSVGDDHIYSNF